MTPRLRDHLTWAFVAWALVLFLLVVPTGASDGVRELLVILIAGCGGGEIALAILALLQTRRGRA